MKEIRGDAKNIRTLLGNFKFSIDYYQREYSWEKRQITELLDDLITKFQDSHEPDNERSAVESYGHYFLGSIIISDKDGQKFIIDGQQRLTSLTLLLIHIHRLLNDESQGAQVAELIFSQRFGKRSFNLDVDERNDCMEALFTGQVFEEDDQPSSVVNIMNRYRDIEEKFSQDLAAEALPYFADWLMENVHLVEITAYSDDDAYTIFETMNDRGLSLPPTDMLKGYLLANIADADRRNSAGSVWRDRITALHNIGKDDGPDAIKSWLRSQHAQTIRDRSRGAEPRDFESIGTEFHRWVRDHEEQLGLRNSADFGTFIENQFNFYGRWYERIRQAAESRTPNLEAIYYNSQNSFTLQYPVLLASLIRTDTEKEINLKLSIVSSFLDILIARRIWNGKSTSYSTMQHRMFQLILQIRGKSSTEVGATLTESLETEEDGFASNERFSLHGRNSPQIHRILARMTDYVESNAGLPSRYAEYIERGRNGYEIEHIWADKFDRHKNEFDNTADFADYRNRIGGLLLLPKKFNASLGDKSYAEKRDDYFGQNLLAKSLHANAYQNNPGFKQFIQKTGLKFEPHVEFKKADVDARQSLYTRLAEQIWNPPNLVKEVSESPHA